MYSDNALPLTLGVAPFTVAVILDILKGLNKLKISASFSKRETACIATIRLKLYPLAIFLVPNGIFLLSIHYDFMIRAVVALQMALLSQFMLFNSTKSDLNLPNREKWFAFQSLINVSAFAIWYIHAQTGPSFWFSLGLICHITCISFVAWRIICVFRSFGRVVSSTVSTQQSHFSPPKEKSANHQSYSLWNYVTLMALLIGNWSLNGLQFHFGMTPWLYLVFWVAMLRYKLGFCDTKLSIRPLRITFFDISVLFHDRLLRDAIEAANSACEMNRGWVDIALKNVNSISPHLRTFEQLIMWTILNHLTREVCAVHLPRATITLKPHELWPGTDGGGHTRCRNWKVGVSQWEWAFCFFNNWASVAAEPIYLFCGFAIHNNSGNVYDQ